MPLHKRQALILLIPVFISLVWAAAGTLPLAWDGSYYLFQALEHRQPVAPHNRFSDIFIQLPFLAAVRFLTNDAGVLGLLFCLTYALIPFIALCLSWIVLRNSPRLFVWPVLGICIATLPGQSLFVGESNIALQFFWIILAVILSGMQGGIAWIAVLATAVFIFFLHPVAGVLLGAAALAAFLLAGTRVFERGFLLPVAMALLLLAAVKYVCFGSTLTQYEKGLLSLEGILTYFGPQHMLVFLFMPLVYTAGIAMVLRSRRNGIKSFFEKSSSWLILLAGVVLLLYVMDPHKWVNGIGYRGWALIASLPFMALAVLDRPLGDGDTFDDRNRMRVIQAAVVVFSVVISVQSAVWFNLTRRLQQELSTWNVACVPLESLQWAEKTPLDFWSTPSLAVVLQGRGPEKLVLAGDGCAEFERSGQVRIAPWHLVRPGGWWGLSKKGRGHAPP